MQIYGREVLTSDQLWQLYTQMCNSPDIWQAANFATVAKDCGLKRVTKRKNDYFYFNTSNFTTGQAIVTKDLIEEIRLFIGNEPKELSEANYMKDRHKIALLAKEFVKLLTGKLGEPRQLNNNDIYEYNGLRVRVLANNNVWVVISNMAIQKQLGVDYFSA